jgi:hypothetical protein
MVCHSHICQCSAINVLNTNAWLFLAIIALFLRLFVLVLMGTQ